MLVLAPALALAQDLRPAEVPPADFFARQYIDSKGCVFLRTDAGGWQARASRDGSPICGYPPTLSARGLEGKPRLRALDPDAGRSRAELLEQALSETVLTNVRPGELAVDPQPMEKLPDLGPEPAPTGPADELRAAIKVAPELRQEMGGGLKPNLRLCELLGYDGKPVAGGLGKDPSQGYCASLPPADLSRLSFARPIGSSARDQQMQDRAGVAKAVPSPKTADAANAGQGTPDHRAGRAAKADPGKATKAAVNGATNAMSKPRDTVARTMPAEGGWNAGKPPARSVTSGPAAAKPKGAKIPSVGMIPAGARYVQLGTFADPGNADRAVQRVLGMGYQALRGRDRVNGREVQFIMAGPFPDRESIVRALSAIRGAGYRDAFPR